MRVIGKDGAAPDSEGRPARYRWGSRGMDEAERGARAAQRTPMEGIANRIGFASFERVCVALTASAVLAGCGILFRAAFDRPNPAGDAAIAPTIIVAKREKPVEEPPAQPGPSAQPPAESAPAPHGSVAPGVSILSQTPIRESAREALARAAPPEANQSAAAVPPDDVLSYADAAKIAEAGAPAAEAVPQNVSADEGGRSANCFVKIGGRVLSRGGCKVAHKGSAVILAHGGGPTVTIAPGRGREWTLSVGGRTVGKVYRSGAACWGSRNHIWVCEKGA